MHANVAVGGWRMCKYARILVSQTRKNMTFHQVRCLLLMWRVWFMQVWHGLSHKPLTLAFSADSCWLNRANEWSTSLHHRMWPPHMHCCESRYLNANKASGTSPHLFYVFPFFMAPLGKSPRGFTSSRPPPPPHHQSLHSHLITVCLYFNSSPGTTSLLNVFSDTFSDHFCLATLERLQLKMFCGGNDTRRKVLCLSLFHLMTISLFEMA